MHLPIAHLSGFEEDPSEEIQAQLQGASSGSHSHDDEEGSNSQSQRCNSKDGTSGDGSRAADDGGADGEPPKDLPCPRCQSMNTKFCYFNNYSVKQPRHFCRNCQRYWTVGGTLRNVPVGGGSRKKPTRSRTRTDPYYRPDGPASSGPAESEEDTGSHGQQHPAMAAIPHGPLQYPDDGTVYPDFPFHPSQISSLLQFALQPPSLGLGLPPFLDPLAGTTVSAEEEAELRAFYEATGAPLLGSAAAMMGSGLWVPELEPAHMALMHKAALWAEAQRLQSMVMRQAQAAAWADQKRECKPVVSPPILQQRIPTLEDINQRQQANSSLHRRPGFWETALMHSRPSKRPAGPTSQTSPPREAQSNPSGDNSQPGDSADGASRAAASGDAYSQAEYDVESPSWMPSTLNSHPEMFY